MEQKRVVKSQPREEWELKVKKGSASNAQKNTQRSKKA